jgi:hypothetical protein
MLLSAVPLDAQPLRTLRTWPAHAPCTAVTVRLQREQPYKNYQTAKDVSGACLTYRWQGTRPFRAIHSPQRDISPSSPCTRSARMNELPRTDGAWHHGPSARSSSLLHRHVGPSLLLLYRLLHPPVTDSFPPLPRHDPRPPREAWAAVSPCRSTPSRPPPARRPAPSQEAPSQLRSQRLQPALRRLATPPPVP